MDEIIANIIFILHLFFTIAIIYIPFTKDEYLLNLYIIIIPFILYHWATNDDTCILTILEQKLRKTTKKETFFQRLLDPIYNVPNDVIGILSKTYLLLMFYYVMIKTKRIKL